ncbi:hypothetical protein [Methylobacterium haplocladii]|uniref:Uncharacterized protein n=1 Tax=Methylobacterium haplocladii TaxID=1176176 RepID=A0A512INB5_9HYPH|nr:hypothetical protein [Methylobacterium haplocladii]GEO99190.1 hypothetical protein MHA02_15780 [Methylobacterium haplocladii]GJD83167.1 hypothetical protein HPGCJGGD_1030 [Methylobacterium haplocladii]GLS59106.1 hypothetical protein GCM10007887_17720 [Methylobacterium haplocladii]
MRHTILSAGLATILLAAFAVPVSAFPSCVEGERKVQEASALRYQARQEARLGNHDRVCDTLDEVGDRYHDAQGAFEDCGSAITSIDIRGELRNLRLAKRVNRCD